MPRGPGKRKRQGRRTGTFDPEDASKVKHMRIGVWDFYEERRPILGWDIPGIATLEHYLEVTRSLPYVWRMIKDISSIPNCWLLILVYVSVELIQSLIPAVSLWYSALLCNVYMTLTQWSGIPASC